MYAWDGDVTELGWLMAVALAHGPGAALSHVTAVHTHGLLLLGDVVRLQQAVVGRTRSPAEAEVLSLCHEHGVTLPRVNQHVNGVEADFHWPQTRTILEVDGWAWHKDRAQFEEDRRRELIHAAAGWQVVRASARQVFETPQAVIRAICPSVL